jgi:hypothetical protein
MRRGPYHRLHQYPPSAHHHSSGPSRGHHHASGYSPAGRHPLNRPASAHHDPWSVHACVRRQPPRLHWYVTKDQATGVKYVKMLTLSLSLGVSCRTDADCGFALIICKDGVCGL